MADPLYNLVFKGELAKGAELAQAKLNLGKLFKISAEKVEALFSGKPVVLKKGLDFDTGNKYRVAIKKAGCRVDLVELASPKPAPQASSQGRAVFGVPDEAPPSAHAPVAPSEASPAVSASSEDEAAATAFDLAEPGSDVLREDEREPVVAQELDVSAFSLANAGGDLLAENEKTHFEARDIAPSNISVAAPGTDVLAEDERTQVEAVEVDLSALSLAQAGEDLGQEKPDVKPLNPDISGLQLEP